MSAQSRTAPQPSALTAEGMHPAHRQQPEIMQASQTQASPEFNRLELRLTNSAIDKYCNHMSLDEAVPSRAIAILRQFVEETSYWTDRHAMIAACIFIACRECGVAMEYTSVRAAVGAPTVLGLAVLLAIENQYYRRNADIKRHKFRAMSADDECYMVTPPSGPSAMISRAYGTSDPKLVDLLSRSQETALEMQPEIIGYKIKTVCRYVYLGDDVAVLAASIFKDFTGQYPDDAVIAASIFLACRECDKFLEYATILDLMARRLSGIELSILLEVEKTHYREARGGADEAAIGKPKYSAVSRQMSSTVHALASRAWTIWPPGREEVQVRADYNSRNPKIIDLCRQSPKLDGAIRHENSRNTTVALYAKESMPIEEGDTVSTGAWELVEPGNDELQANEESRDMGTEVAALADFPGGSPGGWTLC